MNQRKTWALLLLYIKRLGAILLFVLLGGIMALSGFLIFPLPVTAQDVLPRVGILALWMASGILACSLFPKGTELLLAVPFTVMLLYRYGFYLLFTMSFNAILRDEDNAFYSVFIILAAVVVQIGMLSYISAMRKRGFGQGGALSRGWKLVDALFFFALFTAISVQCGYALYYAVNYYTIGYVYWIKAVIMDSIISLVLLTFWLISGMYACAMIRKKGLRIILLLFPLGVMHIHWSGGWRLLTVPIGTLLEDGDNLCASVEFARAAIVFLGLSMFMPFADRMQARIFARDAKRRAPWEERLT